MPIYQYACTTCGKEFEVFQHNSESYDSCDKVTDCSENGELKKLVSSFATNVKIGHDAPPPSCGSGGCGCM